MSVMDRPGMQLPLRSGSGALRIPPPPATLEPVFAARTVLVDLRKPMEMIRSADPQNPEEWQHIESSGFFPDYGSSQDYRITQDGMTLSIRIFSRADGPERRYEAVLGQSRFPESDAARLAGAADKRMGLNVLTLPSMATDDI